jgi:ABC-type nitrate/sulfonate/bicarbonate transport system substrate-binding protein
MQKGSDMGMISKIASWMIGCAVLVSANAAFGQAPQRNVTIALSSGSIGAAASRIAKEMGFFAKYNIDPKIVIMENSGVAIAALLSDSANLAVAGSTELIVAHSRGQKLVGIATAYAGFPASLVLAKSVADKLGVSPNAPVAERLKALDGILLATPSPTAIGSVIMRGAAQTVGANLRFTYMAQPAMPAALESGAIQGFQSSAPAYVLPIVKGTAVLWISGPKGELPAEVSPIVSTVLQTTRSYAEANPALMKDIASAFTDLANAIKERPADVKATLAKLYPELDAATVDIVFAAESLGWNAKKLTPEIMAHEIKLAKSSGIPLQNPEGLDPAAMIFP